MMQIYYELDATRWEVWQETVDGEENVGCALVGWIEKSQGRYQFTVAGVYGEKVGTGGPCMTRGRARNALIQEWNRLEQRRAQLELDED